MPHQGTTARRGTTAPGLTRRTDRGSAMLMTIVCLVMMVLLGTAYMQVARVDRRATKQLTSIDNMGAVRDAVIAYMKKVLREDIVMDSNIIFNDGAPEYIESYDYPWTNSTVTFNVTSGGPNADGLAIGAALPTQAKGGRFDDMWLAETYIEEQSAGTAGTPRFAHVSNMRGIFLRLPKSGAATMLPKELVVDGTSPLQSDGFGTITTDTNLVYDDTSVYAFNNNTDATYTEPGIDTDGDGIRDARWTWAPDGVTQIGSTAYVVAYRIIDLSSMVNVNVATGINGPLWSNQPTSGRGYFPTDLSLSEFILRSSRGTAAEVNAIHTRRTLPASPLPVGTYDFAMNGWATGSRAAAWVHPTTGARLMSAANTARYDIANEMELRSRGGLNNKTTTVPLESDAPNFLRELGGDVAEAADPGGPNTINNAPAAAGTNTGPDWTVHGYMHGGKAKFTAAPPNLNDTNHNFPNTRHMVTTYSGANLFSPRIPGYTGTANDTDARMPIDLVSQFNPDTQGSQRVLAIRDRLNAIFNIGEPRYLGLGAGDSALLDQIATGFALAIQDYSDKNNTPTGYALGGVNYYGMEILPFIREFYLQAGYETMDDVDANSIFDNWKLKPASVAFAIELGNPFDRQLNFDPSTNGAEVQVRIVKGGSAVMTYAIPASTPKLRPRKSTGTSDPDLATEQIVFYSNPTTPINEGGKGADIIADQTINTRYGAGSAAYLINITPGQLPDSAIDGSDLSVELQVKDGAGTWVTYDRLIVPGMKLDAMYADNVTPIATPKVAHGQIAMMRDGQKTRYISNAGRIVTAARTPASAAAYSVNECKIGKDAKGNTSPDAAILDTIQIAVANHRMFNIAELGYICMQGFTNAADGDFPARISGVNGEGFSGAAVTSSRHLRRWFLSLGTSANNPEGRTPGAIVPSATQIPHFSSVLDHFTTISPRYDGMDNDGLGGVDDANELFVPGRMNINTTPWWLLCLTSPVPETSTDLQGLFGRVRDYRDDPSQRYANTGNGTTGGGIAISTASTDSRLRGVSATNRGFSSLGELLVVRRTYNASSDIMRYEGTNPPTAMRPYPHPDYQENGAALTPVSGERYTAQARMSRFQYMANTLTTRSDRYCAYVVIRAYPAGDFRGAPSDTLKFYCLLDRSKVFTKDDTVVVTPPTGQKQ